MFGKSHSYYQEEGERSEYNPNMYHGMWKYKKPLKYCTCYNSRQIVQTKQKKSHMLVVWKLVIWQTILNHALPINNLHLFPLWVGMLVESAATWENKKEWIVEINPWELNAAWIPRIIASNLLIAFHIFNFYIRVM